MRKKSQGLSLNVIIIAALGLIVLFILALIFREESAKFVKGTGCSAKEGVCLANRNDCPEDKPVKVYANDCTEVELKDGIYVAKEGNRRPGQCCIRI